MSDNSEAYVLMTKQELYFVEYLLNELVFSDSISEAMLFHDLIVAGKFKEMLIEKCELHTLISRVII